LTPSAVENPDGGYLNEKKLIGIFILSNPHWAYSHGRDWEPTHKRLKTLPAVI